MGVLVTRNARFCIADFVINNGVSVWLIDNF